MRSVIVTVAEDRAPDAKNLKLSLVTRVTPGLVTKMSVKMLVKMLVSPCV